METYALVRHTHYIEGKSQRQISHDLGLNRRTIKKIIDHSKPPGYRRIKGINQPKLDPHKEWIDEILESDKVSPPKQRHTATRIYHRLLEERGYSGKYTIVRSYIASKREKCREMFVPLIHAPGTAQADFGEARVIIGGKTLQAHFFVMQLPYSDSVFVKAYPVENTESFCDGHSSAFNFFGGVPSKILYDNTTIAVKKILPGGARETTNAFTALKSHYLFESVFANVGRGNEKGGVENLVGYVRRNFMVPVPNFESFAELNKHLASCCEKRSQNVLRGYSKTVRERFSEERLKLLPNEQYESCKLQPGRITKQSLVRFLNNDYSVPTHYGCQKVWVKGYHDRIVIILSNKIIAEHIRSYGKEEVCFNPLHYLKLLERKSGAFEQAAPVAEWRLHPIFEKVKNILIRKNGKSGLREYIRILQFLEYYSERHLQRALEQAMSFDAVSEVAILHLLKKNIEKRPHKLITSAKATLPEVTVTQTDISAYSRLLSTSSSNI